MNVALWFRRAGRADGLWWTLSVDGVERHASSVLGAAAFKTDCLPGPSPDTPLDERRNVVVLVAIDRIEWRGTEAIIHSLLGGQSDAAE